MNAFKRFLFEQASCTFFERSSLVFYFSSVYFYWQHDWTVYGQMAPFVYSTPGLFARIPISFPPISAITAIQWVGTLCAIFSAVDSRVRLLPRFGVAIALSLLDLFSNGFGFINVQIHLVWFCWIYAVVPIFASRAWWKSFCFRSIELVVVLAYVQSFLSKMWASGPAWATEGTVLQIGILRQGLLAGRFIAESNSLSIALSLFTVVFEAAFALYFFLPDRYKRLLLSSAVLFHLGTWVMLGIGFYHLWVMNLCLTIWGLGHLTRRPSPNSTLFAKSSISLTYN